MVGVEASQRLLVAPHFRVYQLAVVFGREFGVVADMQAYFGFVAADLPHFLLVVELGQVFVFEDLFDSQPLSGVEF